MTFQKKVGPKPHPWYGWKRLLKPNRISAGCGFGPKSRPVAAQKLAQRAVYCDLWRDLGLFTGLLGVKKGVFNPYEAISWILKS